MLALTIAWRELRGGVHDFRIFLGCLIIGVLVISMVGNLSGRIERGIQEEATALLGGDIEISLTNVPATPEQCDFFSSYGMYSTTVSLRAMAAYHENTVLVELKGVDDAYPLSGNVQLASRLPIKAVLAHGRIVAEEALFSRLGAKPHDIITIGNTAFNLADVLQKEPDHIASAFSLGPRVMASITDLQKAGLLLPGGLVKYNYHILLHDPGKLEAFKKALAQNFPHASWVVKTANDNNRTVKNLIQRLQLFMTLAGLSSLLIGGVGILNAAESYIAKKLETIAVMKTLGASRNLVFCIYILVLLAVSVLGTFLSAVAGSVLSIAALPYLGRFFPISTHIFIDYKSIMLAMVFGLLAVFSFSIAALGRAVEVKPTLLFRGLESLYNTLPAGKLIINIILVLLLIGILAITSSDKTVALGFIASAIVCFFIFSAAAYAIKKMAQKIHPGNMLVRHAVANLHRPAANTFSIILSIGVGLTVLIALLQVEGNIRREITETIPTNAPSAFFIDIQPSQKNGFVTLLQSKPYISNVFYAPMVRGRISRLNNIPVENAPIGSDAKWATESDRGFSYAAAMPPDTTIVSGKWWPDTYQGKPLLSLDRNLAKGMGLKLGDTLTLNILGQEITADIASLRDVNYANFHINFAIILSPGALEKFPATFIATARIDGNENIIIRELSKQFPNISTIRVKDSLLQLAGVIDDISIAISITAIAVLASGLLVLSSALAAALDKRKYDTVVMKVLGAKRSDILKIFLMEWLILAVITACIASVLGSAVDG